MKIPGTEAGLPAIEDMIAAGRSINVTLIFSLERHRQVMDAYIRGIERLVADGGDPKAVSSVASYFVSRVDTEADKRLDEIGRTELKGGSPSRTRSSPTGSGGGVRRRALGAARGGGERRSSGASGRRRPRRTPSTATCSTSSRSSGRTRSTRCPEETITAFQDHGEVALTLEDGVEEAEELFAQLAEAGVDYDDVTETLEREGVEKFSDSFAEALDGIRQKQGELTTA